MSSYHDAYGRPAQGAAQPAMQPQRKCASRRPLRRYLLAFLRYRWPGLRVQLGRCVRRHADTRAFNLPDRKSTIIDHEHDVGRGGDPAATSLFGPRPSAGLRYCKALSINNDERWAPCVGLEGA